MGLFNFTQGNSIDNGVQMFEETPGAVLVDVRTPQEYSQGHIPESVNVPLQDLGRIADVAPDKATPLFVYCQSGMRSAQATSLLKRAGYESVENIGGIMSYSGKLERA